MIHDFGEVTGQINNEEELELYI